MKEVYYCDKCSSTKIFKKRPGIAIHQFKAQLPEEVLCGFRGCMGTSTRKECTFCKTNTSNTWHKCCPLHTSEQGDDFVCDGCAKSHHPEWSVPTNVFESEVRDIADGKRDEEIKNIFDEENKARLGFESEGDWYGN